MNKENKLIVIAAKAVLDTTLRKTVSEGEATKCIRDVYLECCRNFYRLELQNVKTTETCNMLLSMGYVHECEIETHTILGECVVLCEKNELTLLPTCMQFLENVLADFIPSILEAEIFAVEAIVEYQKGNVEFEVTREKVKKYFDFLGWSQEDYDNQFPQTALLSGTDIRRNEEVNHILEEAWSTYSIYKQQFINI